MATYIGTKYGDNAAQEWTSKAQGANLLISNWDQARRKSKGKERLSQSNNDQSQGWAKWDFKGDSNSAKQLKSHEREARDQNQILKCEIDLNFMVEC